MAAFCVALFVGPWAMPMAAIAEEKIMTEKNRVADWLIFVFLDWIDRILFGDHKFYLK